MRVMLVDDHIMFREGLSGLIQAYKDIEVVGEAGNVHDAIDLAQRLRPELILMDFGLTDGTGVQATTAILGACPETKVVFLSVEDSNESLFAALRSGASGYLLKNLSTAKLIAAIRGLNSGEAPLSRKMTTEIIQEFSRPKGHVRPSLPSLSHLTMREVEILQLLAKGYSNQEIAVEYSLSEPTVKNHVHVILKKLGVTNRREAAHYARQQGLTSPL